VLDFRFSMDVRVVVVGMDRIAYVTIYQVLYVTTYVTSHAIFFEIMIQM
jgi:hypothetical protein